MNRTIAILTCMLISVIAVTLPVNAQTDQTPQYTVKQSNVIKPYDLQKRAISDHDDSVWFYEIESLISQDIDDDGYFQNLTLNIDLDSEYQQQDVYVDIVIVNANEVEELVYSSDIFSLNYQSDKDEQQFDFQFLHTWTTDYYQVQIYVYDAYSDELLTSTDGNEFLALQDLPLEGSDYDQDQQISLYSVSVQSLQDADHDGYAERIKVSLDADVNFGQQAVYAEFYIDNERIYSSDIFNLYGDSAADTQYFNFGLASGYASHYYDLAIIIRDADYDQQLHYLSAQDWVSLDDIALESQEYIQDNTVDVEVVHSGGAFNYLLLMLSALLILRVKNKQTLR